MRTILLGLVLLTPCGAAGAKGQVYRGTWVTTNRILDGKMTCVVTSLGPNKWRGHFSGSFDGRSFSYKVVFRGPPDNLRGQAVINGADYTWAGEMAKGSPGSFKGKFRSRRYRGHFSLKQQGG